MARVSAIWAQDRNRVIGSKTSMLWSVPEDLAHFQKMTLGCPIIMGRGTFEALGKPLPGRTNIVITRQSGYQVPWVYVTSTIDEALSIAQQEAAHNGCENIWVTGGGQIYQQTLPLVDRIYLTQVDLEVADADPVFAPDLNASKGFGWELNQELSDQQWRPRSGDARWKLEVYDRRPL